MNLVDQANADASEPQHNGSAFTLLLTFISGKEIEVAAQASGKYYVEEYRHDKQLQPGHGEPLFFNPEHVESVRIIW